MTSMCCGISLLGVAIRAGTHTIQQQAPIPCRRTSIYHYLLGDSGYKTLLELVIPYTSIEEGRDPIGRLRWFNFRHSTLRMCVERAFDHFKIVFRVVSNAESCLKAETKRAPFLFFCA